MKMRSVAHTVFVLAVVVVVEAGCGGNGDDAAPPPSQPSPPPIVETGQPGRFDGAVTALLYAPDQSGDVYVAGTFTTYGEWARGLFLSLSSL